METSPGASQMATPFVPVPVPNQLRSAGCQTRPSRTSTPSTSSGCSPPGRTPWVRPSGTTAVCHSPTQPGFSPEEDYGGRTRGNRVEDGALPSSVLGDGGVKDGWMERPTTPTLLGYEVMEERAKFTVYKILVTGHRGESWVIFRRYTDFSRLNDKLKEIFPRFRLSLPPKRWFRDNYDTEFLEDRQIGLQTFLQNLLAHKDIINSEVVRQFLCLDDPPGPFDSLEESRAFCETLEETNHRLQRELLEKQREISSLRAELQDRDTQLRLLEQRLSGESLSPDYCESPCHQSAAGAESSGYAEPEPIEHGPTDTSPDRPTDTSPDGHTDTSPDGHTDIDKNGGGDQMSSISKTDQDSMLKTSCESCGPEKGCGAYWNTLTINASPIAS